MPEHFAFFGPDLRGRLLDGRYLLESIVGGGGSGTVYAACDRRLKRRVAVKVIHPEHTRLDEQRQRIRQEALVGAQINHPNVAPILDFNVAADDRGEQLYFIVMPLLEGRGLREVILGGPIPWATACLWTRQLLAGLAALHSRGVLHRDVKSDNCVLVGEGGREVLKLLDLRLAKVTRAGLVSRSLRTTTGRVLGTLAYVSPEQALGEPLDERADLYAVGVVLFELLVRRPPFVGTVYEVLSGHVERTPPRPSETSGRTDLPPVLDAIVVRVLSKRREERFASAIDFDRALACLLEQEGLAVELDPGTLGTNEVQAALAAWRSFDYPRAQQQAEAALLLNRAWAPLAELFELAGGE